MTDFFKYIDLLAECLVRLDKQAYKKFGSQVQEMSVAQVYSDKFIGKVITKDGRSHRMTIKL